MPKQNMEYHGINRANLDETVNPAEDFYSYACGGWMKANPLKPDYSSFGTFDKVHETARTQLRELITGLKDHPDAGVTGSIAQKVSDIYAMGMDMQRRNSEGNAPLIPLLEKVENSDIADLFLTLAWLHSGVGGGLFSTGVGPDPENSDMNIMHIGETSLGLGDRDYYLVESDDNKRIMEAYKKYIRRLMELSGYSADDSSRICSNVLSIENEFAKNKKSREERRNPLLSCNKYSFSRLETEFPAIEWKKYFKALGITDLEQVNVSSVNFLTALNRLLPTLTERQLKDYLLFRVADETTDILSDDFFEAGFELYGRVMTGQEEPKPLWKRAMVIPNSMFGEAVGLLYVEKYFPEESKNRMLSLVGNLRKALAQHISQLDWMNEATKSLALDKLSAMTVKIGYPDKWKDYSEIIIDPHRSYMDNILEASRWFVRDNYNKLGKPVDKSEWHMTPQTVNAYYSPVSNEICFPAAILQAPYFDPSADDAVNYGAIGVVIGHEMTHGFDDQGRRFDKNGNLSNWWRPEDEEKFNQLSERLVKQFDKVEVLPGVHANGTFTLGENIADQGGLRIALTAYRMSCEGKGEPKEIDNFSPLQRFYLSYANVWAGNMREENILLRTKTDPHSLGRNRVNVTLRNIEPFFDAFGIKEGDKMYRKEGDRVIIW